MTVTTGQGPYEFVLYNRVDGPLVPVPPTIPPTIPTPPPVQGPDVLTEIATNNTNDSSFTFTGLTSGDYSVSVRDFFGCEFPVRVDLTDPDALTATASATDYTCDAESTLTITASGGTTPYSYSIDGVDFTNTTGVSLI